MQKQCVKIVQSIKTQILLFYYMYINGFSAFQLKQNLMKGKEKLNLCGQFLKFIIRNLDIFMISFTGEKQLVEVSFKIQVCIMYNMN